MKNDKLAQKMTNWLKSPSPVSPESTAVIAEVAQAHDGSLGMAHAFIDAVAATGADAIKFQTHIASEESTRDEPWRVKFSLQDESRYDYWRRMEFTQEQWSSLKTHAEETGLIFLSSPFSMAAVDLLERLGMRAWKVASGEVTNRPMIERMAATGKPVMLSSGLSDFADIDRAVSWIAPHKVPYAVFQCATAYPCPPEKVGLNVLGELRERYPDAAVGLSDHSAKIYPGLAAATLGASLIEVHVTLSPEMFGPDTKSSLTSAQLGDLVEGVRFINTMQHNPVDKSTIPDDLQKLRGVFTKSIVAARNLAAGTVLSEADLALKKPGGGLEATRLDEVIGRTLRTDIARDTKIRLEDID